MTKNKSKAAEKVHFLVKQQIVHADHVIFPFTLAHMNAQQTQLATKLIMDFSVNLNAAGQKFE